MSFQIFQSWFRMQSGHVTSIVQLYVVVHDTIVEVPGLRRSCRNRDKREAARLCLSLSNYTGHEHYNWQDTTQYNDRSSIAWCYVRGYSLLVLARSHSKQEKAIEECMLVLICLRRLFTWMLASPHMALPPLLALTLGAVSSNFSILTFPDFEPLTRGSHVC